MAFTTGCAEGLDVQLENTVPPVMATAGMKA